MPDVVGALVGMKEAECGHHQRADLIEAARPRGAHERFQLREGEFDGIEIGTVGRKETELRAHLLDRGADLGLLVNGQVIHHDDVAGAQRRDQDLLDIGAERHRIDRSVEHRRRAQLGGTQRRDDRVGLPVTARRVIGRTRPARTARIPTKQIRGDARFVDEDKPGGVVEGLPLAPLPTRGGDISAPLFGGVYRFF